MSLTRKTGTPMFMVRRTCHRRRVECSSPRIKIAATVVMHSTTMFCLTGIWVIVPFDERCSGVRQALCAVDLSCIRTNN